MTIQCKDRADEREVDEGGARATRREERNVGKSVAGMRCEGKDWRLYVTSKEKDI